MNNKYLFFHDKRNIHYFDLSQPFIDQNLRAVALKIDQFEEDASIDQIRMSSNNSLIAIIIKEEEDSVIFKWNLNENSEILMKDVQGPFKILFDYEGEMYILNKKGVFFTDMCCNMKAFQYQDLDKLKNTRRSIGLGSERGVRMDGKNHNWLIMEEYMSLPFSYMTFVIKNFIETVSKETRDKYVFDAEPYNYLLNKSTSFLDGNFVRIDATQLQNILHNFLLLDKGLLEILHYT